MALRKIITTLLALCIVSSQNIASDEPAEPQQILYLMHTGHLSDALDVYTSYKQRIGKHDLELIQQIGLILIDNGMRRSDPESQLMTLFGAGISTHERCFYILEQGLKSHVPQLQLVAMNFLARWQHDSADEALNRMLGSEYLLIRLEALSHLAEKKHPKAVGQAEALMAKLDTELVPIFPQFFAMIGDASSIRALKKLLTSPNEKVRVAAVLSAAKYKRDELLPQIQRLASHHDMIQQEACAVALGLLGDESSIPKLEKIALSGSPLVRLAALQSLHRLGKKEVRKEIENMANANNLYAISILGEMEGSEATLAELAKSSHLNTKINAIYSLLERQDRRCLAGLADFLIHDTRDLAFSKNYSLSRGLSYIKATPSSHSNNKDDSVAFEVSLEIREQALSKALDLPSSDFLKVADTILELQQNELIPLLTELLENLNSKEAIALLKKYQQKAGAPLIRNYCNLALFNMQEKGPYEANLRKWITSQQDETLVQLRPFVPMDARDPGKSYQLTPHETSKLLIASFESFARTQDDKGIDVLLDALKNGNSKNKYALAGLLIRSTL